MEIFFIVYFANSEFWQFNGDLFSVIFLNASLSWESVLYITISIAFSAVRRLMIQSSFSTPLFTCSFWQDRLAGFQAETPCCCFQWQLQIYCQFFCLPSFIHSSAILSQLWGLSPWGFYLWSLTIVELACYRVEKCGQVGPSEKKTYQQPADRALCFGSALPLLGWLICDPRRKAEMKVFLYFGLFNVFLTSLMGLGCNKASSELHFCGVVLSACETTKRQLLGRALSITGRFKEEECTSLPFGDYVSFVLCWTELQFWTKLQTSFYSWGRFSLLVA